MSDEPKKRTRPWVLWTLIAVVLLVYPLSMGPASHYAINSNDPIAGIDRMETVYAPIFWLRRHSELVKAAVDWYVRLFN
jgi:capsule polysaccharide export protein KpsC/LpsZ